MMFDRSEAAACPINEFQIAVAGGINAEKKLTDLVELYDVREDTWKICEIGLSSPRRQMCMSSS